MLSLYVLFNSAEMDVQFMRMLQPVFQGSTHEAASDNSNVNHYVEGF